MTGETSHIDPFKELLVTTCGLSFADGSERTLTDAIAQRMREREVSGASHYYSLLLSDRDELQALIELLTVNETYFFREPDYLHLVVDRIVPELLKARRDDEVVRIVCVGCASGEEPYSLAMLLDQRFGAENRHRFAIAAGDIDAGAIATARRAVYRQGSFRSTGADLCERYFTPHGPEAWQLGEIRHHVHFEPLNLLSDSYPPPFRQPDIIFYRNVSIYFPSHVQKEIFSRLAAQLNDGGYLFVGASETMHHNLGILSLVEQDALFFFRKLIRPAALPPQRTAVERPLPDAHRRPSRGAARHRPQPAEAPDHPKTAERRTTKAATDLHSLFREALIDARRQRADQALRLLDRIIETDASFSKAYALKGSILADMNRLPEAEHLCQTALQHNPLCLEACLLLGVSARHQGDNTEARRRFREALYLDRSCWPAHFYLAEIAYSGGDAGRARERYRTVIEVLGRRTDPVGEESFFPLSFNAEHFISVCRHKLSLINGKPQ